MGVLFSRIIGLFLIYEIILPLLTKNDESANLAVKKEGLKPPCFITYLSGNSPISFRSNLR